MEELTAPVAPKSFEEALARLEEIAGRLDRNDVPLADALRYCAEAAELMRYCRAQLAEAEGKLERLTTGDNGNLQVVSLEEE